MEIASDLELSASTKEFQSIDFTAIAAAQRYWSGGHETWTFMTSLRYADVHSQQTLATLRHPQAKHHNGEPMFPRDQAESDHAWLVAVLAVQFSPWYSRGPVKRFGRA